VARFRQFRDVRRNADGSNFLEANLNALPGVTCHGEVFNPHFIGKKDQTALFGMTLRRARPTRWLPAAPGCATQTQGLAGFRYFHDHDPRVFDPVMAIRAAPRSC
jgi:hypothetical protein